MADLGVVSPTTATTPLTAGAPDAAAAATAATATAPLVAAGLESDAVCFGDTVFFYDNDLRGYIYAESPVQSNVTLVVTNSDKNPALNNIKGAVFQMVAPNKYKNAKKLRKRIKSYQKSNINPEEEDPEVIELQKLAKAEARDNVLEQARQRGRALVYGQTIQLRHNMTRMFLHISATDAAVLDVTAMRCSLNADTSKNTFFRIVPRFKVRSEGDIVRYNDQILLESIKSTGQFIHISPLKFPENKLNAKSHEIDLSVGKTSFVVMKHIPYTHVNKNLESLQQYLLGGDVICLLHKESDSYITTEGSFVSYGEFEDVHLRRRKERVNESAVRSNLGITFWQLEHYEDSSQGDVVRWNRWIRLRNMCTRRYLVVRKDNKTGQWHTSSTSNRRDPDTRFAMHAVTRDTAEIPYNAFCRIQHVSSAHWLHATEKPYVRRQYTNRNNISSMDMLEWDNAVCKKIIAIPEMRYDDAYAVLPVEHDLLWQFNYVAGCVPTIARHVGLYSSNATIDNADHMMAMETLTALKEFLTVDDTAVLKSRQKIFRHLRLTDTIVMMLKAPFRAPSGYEHIPDFNPLGEDVETVFDSQRLLNLCRIAYTVLTKYLSGSHKNELYLARHIPFFQSQIGYGLNAATMLMELVNDNRQILDRIEPAQIKAFIGWLEKRSDPSFLTFLKVLCVCLGKPITMTQTYVMDEIMKTQSTHGLLYQTRVAEPTDDEESITKVIQIRRSNTKEQWMDLRRFAKERKDEFAFFMAQLELFSSVCAGRHERNIELVRTDFHSLEECLVGLTHSALKLKPTLRSLYGRLLINVFIDVPPNIPVLNNVKLTFTWENISQQANDSKLLPGEALSGAKLDIFQQLHSFVVQHLKENKVMIASHVEENQFLESVLMLAQRLVLFGYYSDRHYIQELLHPMFDVLDIATDKKSSKQDKKDQREWIEQGECFLESPENSAMAAAKYQGALIMDALFNFRLGSRTKTFLIDYKQLYTFKQKIEASGNMTKHIYNVNMRLDLPAELVTLLPAFEDDPANPVSTETVLHFIEQLCSRDDFLDVYEDGKGRLVDVFLQISRYHNHRLTFMATNLVNRHFSQVWNLFEKSTWSRIIITPESTQANQIANKNIAILRRLVGVKLQATDRKLILACIAEITALCTLKNDALEPNAVNIMILYQSKALQIIFSLMAAPIDKNVKEDFDGMVQIISAGLNFLQKFCKGNVQIQEKMFEHMPFLLSLGEVAICPLSNCLTQMFRSNQELCFKLTDEHVAQMIAYMAKFKVYEISQFLNVIVKIESLQLPIRRNQNMVVKLLQQYRSETLLLVDPKDDEIRTRILVEGSKKTIAMNKLDKGSEEYQTWWSSKENRELLYNVRLVRMLATCCEGENRFIESMCQNIFSSEQLLAVLANDGITMNFRRPYMRFFLWAYLNNDSSAVEAELGEVQLRPEMWFWMRKMLEQTRLIFMKDLTRIFETDEGEQDVIYIMEGCIPFLRVFFERYYRASDELAKRIPDYANVVSTAAQTMLDFIGRMYEVPEFGIKRRIKEVTTVLLIMQAQAHALSDEQEDKLQEILERELARVDAPVSKRRPPEYNDEGKVHIQEAEVGLDKNFMTKSSRREWYKYYEEELKLNDHFHNFTRNLEKAYRADMTTPRYSRSDASGAGMPLGEEYQRQVRAFVEYENTTSRFSAGLGASFGHASKPRYLRLKKTADILIHALQSSRAHYESLEENEREIQYELDLKHLRLLRAPIANEILLLPKEGKFVEDERRAVLKCIAKIQSELNAIGVPSIILTMCTSPEEFTVRASLRLLSVMLYGGNHEIQNAFLYNFRSTRNEAFFADLRERISSSAIAAKEARALQSQLAKDKAKRTKLLASTLKHASSKKTRTVTHDKGSIDHSIKDDPTHVKGASPGYIAMQDISKSTMLTVDATVAEKVAEDQASKLAEDEEETDIVKFKSLVGFTELIFRILQLFCERHNQEMKSYMREQKGNIKMINLVSETVEFLKIIYLNIDDQSWSLARQVLETTVEFSMGEQENQVIVYDTKGLDVVNHIMRVKAIDKCRPYQVYLLKRACSILIRTMVEDANQKAYIMARELLASLDTLAVRRTMKNFSPLLPPQLMDYDPATRAVTEYDPREVGFICYATLCRMRDHLIPEHADIETQLHLRVYGQKNVTSLAGKMELSEFMAGIESMQLEYEDELDQFQDADDDAALKFLKSKAEEEAHIIDKFCEEMESIEIVRNKDIQKVYFPVGTQRKMLSQSRRDVLLWTVNRESPTEKIIDFMEMGEDLRRDMKYQEELQQNPMFHYIIRLEYFWFYSFMLLTLAINVVMVATWQENGLFEIRPLVPSWYQPFIYAAGAVHLFLSTIITVEYLLEHPVRSWRDVLSMTLMYHLVLVGMSVGGIFTEGYLFSFHLLHLVVKNDILKRALQSVTKNGDSLLLVFLLGIILIYIYSVIAFAFYRASYDPLSGLFCESLGQCFVTTLNYGLRAGGGIGDVLPMSQFTWQYVGLRVIYELSFFIIITTIGLNIIFGLIVDTFSELRDEKFRIAEDMRTSCFICSLKAYDFDKQGTGFSFHTKHQHNMWAYLFFLNYLEEKDQDEYTADESYVSEMADQKETGWFPINRALALQQTRDELDERLQSIETKLDDLVERFKREDEFRLIQNQQARQQMTLLTDNRDGD